MSSRRFQLLSGMLAATVSLTLTGCGPNDASSSAPAASAAPAETTAAADSAAASVEPISAEEPVNSFSYIGSDEKTPLPLMTHRPQNNPAAPGMQPRIQIPLMRHRLSPEMLLSRRTQRPLRWCWQTSPFW